MNQWKVPSSIENLQDWELINELPFPQVKRLMHRLMEIRVPHTLTRVRVLDGLLNIEWAHQMDNRYVCMWRIIDIENIESGYLPMDYIVAETITYVGRSIGNTYIQIMKGVDDATNKVESQ